MTEFERCEKENLIAENRALRDANKFLLEKLSEVKRELRQALEYMNEFSNEGERKC